MQFFSVLSSLKLRPKKIIISWTEGKNEFLKEMIDWNGTAMP